MVNTISKNPVRGMVSPPFAKIERSAVPTGGRLHSQQLKKVRSHDMVYTTLQNPMVNTTPKNPVRGMVSRSFTKIEQSAAPTGGTSPLATTEEGTLSRIGFPGLEHVPLGLTVAGHILPGLGHVPRGLTVAGHILPGLGHVPFELALAGHILPGLWTQVPGYSRNPCTPTCSRPSRQRWGCVRLPSLMLFRI